MYKIIDITKDLINPIDNLKNTNLFVQLETLATQKHDQLPKGVWSSKVEKDWNTIRDLCLEILVKHKKDIEVMTWLIEANLHLKQDLYISLEMFNFICKNYWDEQNFPEKAINALDKILCTHLPKHLLLCKSAGKNYTLSDFHTQTALGYEKYEKLTEDELEQSAKLISILNDIIKQVAEKQFHMIKTAKIINDFQLQIEKFTLGNTSFISDNGLSADNTIMQTQTAINRDSNVNPISDHATIQSRTHAYKMIREAMNYLQKHDPHSATPYLLQKALEWEIKSFAEIMQEFNDPSIIRKIFQQN